MTTQTLSPGDLVRFDADPDAVILYGKVLNHLPPDEDGFKGGYHVACYYVVEANDLHLVTEDELGARPTDEEEDSDVTELSAEDRDALIRKARLQAANAYDALDEALTALTTLDAERPFDADRLSH